MHKLAGFIGRVGEGAEMTKYVLLLGCAPEDYRQKKLEEIHGFLTSEEGGLIPEQNIIILPNGTNELLLESTLNGIVDEQPDEAYLYIFAKSAEDLTALSEYEAVGYGKLDIVRLGDEEIRKEIIEYY